MRAISFAAGWLRDPKGSGVSVSQCIFLAFATLLVLVLCVVGPASVQGQTRNQQRQFPYEAIVDTDGVYVRRGGHETKYYPTSRLAKGQRVRVFRHDPGGWFMIAPPEGSFSWIPKRYVNLTSAGVGEVIEDGVVAYVGTEFGNEASVWQRRMRSGDRVEVIGQGRIEVSRDRGPEEMLKIKPPRREYRYIPGHAVIAADEAARMGFDREPVGSNRSDRIADPRSSRSGSFLGARPTSRATPRPRATRSPRSSATTSRPPIDQSRWNRDRARLSELDAKFRAIIEQPPQQWDFAQLETDYLVLKRDAGHPSLGSQVDLRLPALRRYQKKKRIYEDFVSLTSATTKRDQELARMGSGMNSTTPAATDVLSRRPNQSSPAAGFQPPTTVTPGNTPFPNTSAPTLRFPNPNAGQPGGSVSAPPPGGSALSPGQPGVAPPGAPQLPVIEQGPSGQPGQAPAGMSPVPQRHPIFCGAGIIQRSSEPDVPGFVLLTPKGSILAYLEAVPGIDLSRQVNFAMGIMGDRFHSEKLKADYIKVRGVQPINLRP